MPFQTCHDDVKQRAPALRCQRARTAAKPVSRATPYVVAENVGAHAQLARGLDGDRALVARDHLDVDAHAVRLLDGGLGVVARRVVHREQTCIVPPAPTQRDAWR